MRMAEHALVRIVAAVPAERVDGSFGAGHQPAIGDIGVVVHVYPILPAHEAMFIVECVADDGRARWLADVKASELAPVESAFTRRPSA
ncbi:hypothetical protein WBO40_13265 [Lysobacter sp. CCNWLW52]